MAGKHDEPSNVMRLHLEQCGLNVKQQSQTEPIWALSETILEQRDSRALALRKEPVEGVDGAFLVPDVLSDAECATLVNLCDRLGFSGGETLVEVPTKIRNNQVSLLVPPVEMVLEVAHRLRPLIPSGSCKKNQALTRMRYAVIPTSFGRAKRKGGNGDMFQVIAMLEPATDQTKSLQSRRLLSSIIIPRPQPEWQSFLA